MQTFSQGPGQEAAITLGIFLDKQLVGSQRSSPYDATIGQSIQCAVGPVDNSNTIEWTIEGPVVKDYSISIAQGMLTPLSDDDRRNKIIAFTWWRPGNFSVTVKVTRAKGSSVLKQSFNVSSPFIRAHRYRTGVVAVAQQAGKTYMGFYQTIIPQHPPLPPLLQGQGIQIEAEVQGTQGKQGMLAFLQLACNQRFCTMDNGKSYHWSTNGQYVLDIGMTKTLFYQNMQKVLPADNSIVSLDMLDAPAMELGPPLNYAFVGTENGQPEAYLAYVMFRPDGGIWVPLSMIPWSWKGNARILDKKQNLWSEVQDAAWTAQPETAFPYNFPQWNQHTDNGNWEEER